MTSRLERLTAEMRAELVRGILPYWMTSAVDERRGGFIGAITEAEERQPDAPKGGILAARILWTFAAAYRVLGDARYRDMARVAFEQLRARFLDAEHGGLHWMLHADGAVADDRKHVYAQAFAIYGLAEYARATGDLDARHEAIALFRLVELKARDLHHGGYVEAFARDWTPLDDVRLGETDPDYPKSTNTHLHVLEAYANLYRAWQHPSVRDSLAALLHVFLDHLIDPATGHLVGFFEADWRPCTSAVSFGHDIEASWLMMDAAELVEDVALRGRVRAAGLRMAAAVLERAYDRVAGGIFYTRDADGQVDTDKEWWPQAEAIVGFVNAYHATRRDAFLDAAWGTWEFTRRHLVDAAHGEWFRRASREGVRRPGFEKVGPWKCPYHNGRACLELIERAAAPSLPTRRPA